MTTRTNTSSSVRTPRTPHTSNSALGIARAGLALALTPIASLADGAKAVVTGTVAATSTVRPIWEGIPAHIDADYNHSGLVDIDDLFDYLTGWFAGKPSADTNLNGVLEIQDVLGYVNLWMGAYGTKQSGDPRQ